MNILKIKDPQGNWVDIPALKGDKGDPGISPTIDSTLSQANQAADAKAVGDKIDEITLTIDKTLTQSGQVADAKVTGDALNTKADQNGYYENLNVGVADQLASKNYIEDNEAYTFRPIANGAKVGTREFDTIVGGSVVWNQLVDESTASVTIPNTHNYIAKIDGAYTIAVSDGTAVAVTGGTDEVFDVTQMLGSTIADYIYSLEQATTGAGVAWFRKYFPNNYYDYNPGELMHVSDLQSHDMVGFNLFDKTIQRTDNRYLIDNGNIVSNISWSVTDYIPIVGDQTYYLNCTLGDGPAFCWYDSSKAFISGIAGRNATASKLITAPQNAHFLRASIKNTDIDTACINLSGTRDGEYDPYIKHSYPLDSTLTLRGISKLVDGHLSFNGDVYKPDGTVERRYGIVDLGALTWNYQSQSALTIPRFAAMLPKEASSQTYWLVNCVIQTGKYTRDSDIGQTTRDMRYGIAGTVVYVTDSDYTDAETFKVAMSGMYLVYELATPTTEQAEPYQSPQIIDPYGTEEYVTTSIVPIGHQTQYPEDLRAKIESLPWDFANLIAPVEATYKATQNYTAGSLFIVDNILYKATVNIANGGAITPNTNCTPTTLAEIIAAL